MEQTPSQTDDILASFVKFQFSDAGGLFGKSKEIVVTIGKRSKGK